MAIRGKRYLSLGAVLVGAALFVAINVLGNALLKSSRIDLTENRVYTLSEGTRKVLEEITEPITLRFFYSEEQANGYPNIQAYGARLKGLLDQYAVLSGGKVKVEYINPKLFTEDEDMAVALGIADITVDATGNKLYFGLAASNAADDRQAIPFFDPDKAMFVEYDLTRMIHDLSNPKKPKIGLMTWLPMQGGGGSMLDIQGPWVIYQQMKESYDVDAVDKGALTIPKDIDVLMIVHPVNVDEDTLYAIDQYVMRGGKLMVFVDPYTRMNQNEPPASSLEKLFAAWGIEMPAADVVADPDAAIRVQNQDRGSVLESISNPLWLALQPGNFNAGEVVSADLEVMRFIASGHFMPKPVKEGEKTSSLTMTPLVLSGVNSAVVPNYKLMFDADPSQFMAEAKGGIGRQVLAARLSGIAHSAFPERGGKDHLAESKKPTNIILVGDVDMMRDGFWVNKQNYVGKEMLIPTASNGSFVFNALDFLSGGGDLIGLRSRMSGDRPFERVEKLRQEAESKFRKQEEELKMKLANLERRLNDLQSSDAPQGENGVALFSPEQQAELAGFRNEMQGTRKELRAVQLSLRERIEALGMKIKLLNIGLLPVFVLLLALVIPARLGMRRSG